MPEQHFSKSYRVLWWRITVPTFITNYMNETRIIDMMQRIDSYIRGRLNQQEIDELWIEFLKEPEWYRIFETDLHIRSLIRKKGI